jgi:hypothetical protein
MLERQAKVGTPNFFPYVGTIAGGTGVETSQGVVNGFLNGQHTFLPFVANGINSCPMIGQDVISAHFTGCIMAVYTHNGVRKVCHVSSGEFGDCSAAWAAIKAASTNVFEFKPSDFIGGTQFERCYGLITSDLQTFTILTASQSASIPSGQGNYRSDSKFVKVAKARLL